MRKRRTPRKSSLDESRRLMFMASAVWVTLLLVIFVFRGGGTTPIEPPQALSVPSLIQQADALAARGEYGAAAAKYQSAVEREPDAVALHFALGTALSYVGRQEETARQFQWVVARGNPASPEVQMARRWLVRAGVLGEPVRFGTSTTLATEEGQAASGRLKGKTEGRGADSQEESTPVRILLRGEDPGKEEVTLETTVKPGEPYRFDKVPAGKYLLTAYRSESKLWEERVTVEAGTDTVLDLTAANRIAEK